MSDPVVLGFRVLPHTTPHFRHENKNNSNSYVHSKKSGSVTQGTRENLNQVLSSPAPVKKPIVLLRGLGRSSGFWMNFPEYLAQQGHVVMIDLLGTGLSPSVLGRGSIKALAADVVHTLKELELLPCHLCGISLGGMVALEASRLLSENAAWPGSDENNLESLTILASSSRCTGEKRIAPRALAKLLFSLRHSVPKNREFAEFLVSMEMLKADGKLPDVWDAIWKKEGFQKLAVLRQLLAAAHYSAEEALRRLKRPCLFMVSQDDRLVSWRNSARLWEKVQGARLHVMQSIGHDLTTERPQEVASILTKFFLEIEAARSTRPSESAQNAHIG